MHEGAEPAKRYCLQCHKANGFDGEMHPRDPALIAGSWLEPEFTGRVLDPSSVGNGTTTPPLYHHIPDQERRRIAKILFDYHAAVPILQ